MLTLAWIGILKPILSYPAESAKEAKLEKKYQILNNLAVFLSCITTFLNVMITSFNGHSLPSSNGDCSDLDCSDFAEGVNA